MLKTLCEAVLPLAQLHRECLHSSRELVAQQAILRNRKLCSPCSRRYISPILPFTYLNACSYCLFSWKPKKKDVEGEQAELFFGYIFRQQVGEQYDILHVCCHSNRRESIRTLVVALIVRNSTVRFSD